MSDVILRSFPPRLRTLALMAVDEYEQEGPHPTGMGGLRAYTRRSTDEEVYLYCQTTKQGDIVATCTAFKKRRK